MVTDRRRFGSGFGRLGLRVCNPPRFSGVQDKPVGVDSGFRLATPRAFQVLEFVTRLSTAQARAWGLALAKLFRFCVLPLPITIFWGLHVDPSKLCYVLGFCRSSSTYCAFRLGFPSLLMFGSRNCWSARIWGFICQCHNVPIPGGRL